MILEFEESRFHGERFRGERKGEEQRKKSCIKANM